MLLALADALAIINDPAQHREAQSLATYLLGTTGDAWTQQRRPLSVFLLDAWYGLNAYAAKQATAPELAATWADCTRAHGCSRTPTVSSWRAPTNGWPSLS